MRSFRWDWFDVVSRTSRYFGRNFDSGDPDPIDSRSRRGSAHQLSVSVMRLSVSDLQDERSGKELASCAAFELVFSFFRSYAERFRFSWLAEPSVETTCTAEASCPDLKAATRQQCEDGDTSPNLPVLDYQ
jgi:hypothetical protein